MTKKPALISEEYREQLRGLHASEDAPFGVSGLHGLDKILAAANELKVKTILDYGCGKGLLKAALTTRAPHLKVYEYDPAIPGKEHCRPRADLVVCGDVLEHIEPHLLNNVLAHIKSIMEKGGVFTVDHRPATKDLADGRNAHLIQETHTWWEKSWRNFSRL